MVEVDNFFSQWGQLKGTLGALLRLLPCVDTLVDSQLALVGIASKTEGTGIGKTRLLVLELCCPRLLVMTLRCLIPLNLSVNVYWPNSRQRRLSLQLLGVHCPDSSSVGGHN